MTNNRFIDNLNSDTNSLPKLRATMTTDSTTPDTTDFGGMSASEVHSGGRTDHVFTSQQVALAHSRVLQSGILDKLDAWRSEDAHVTGASARLPLISDHATLVGLLLLASEHGPLQISSLAVVLQNRLTQESRTLLHLSDVAPGFAGETREAKRWFDVTHRAFHRMLPLMDPFPQERKTANTYTEIQAVLDAHDSDLEKKMKTRLGEFTKGFLHMTFMQQPRRLRQATHRIELAVDQTFIGSPTTRGFSKNNLAKNVADEIGTSPLSLDSGPVDAFAGWHVHGKGVGRSDFTWGWMANIAVRVDSEHPGESRFPKLAISATLSMPNIGVTEEAVSLMRSALSTGLALGITDADKAYFASSRVERLHEPTFNLGFTPSTDYRIERLGVQGGHFGSTFIEGKAYCASMPTTLQNASRDHVNGTIDAETYRGRIQARVHFELRPKGKPDDQGRVRMMCPAVGANPTVTCRLRERPASDVSSASPRVAENDLPEYPDKICIQHSVTFGKQDGLRERQAFTYGSPEWQEFHTPPRNSAESLNAGVNSPVLESLDDASRRSVRGFAAAQVFVTILLTNYNLRSIAAYLRVEVQDQASNTVAVETTTNARRGDRQRATRCTPEDGAAPTT
ncbi:hypothetical protein E3T25_08900 [Cryobacterium sandaracinum]|uniref:Uncharacterized protein n=1 Tax=Cryobacterium sandaracinum TaxID=1259247 RepID=A0ABY2JBU6_9MICO|nr:MULTISPECIES: hypothetical protein [Cryobacterium]TFC65936.1 hypothetical protein E3O54_11640 [Cryobacterium sp. TMT2-4]TFD02427.1 hypothetical protein E3T25_08900 [Cryobacterium sandaracinum]